MKIRTLLEKRNKLLILLMILGGVVSGVCAEPPEPPVGKRWVLNPDFCDEFNGNSLDTTKWLDHHPTWKGREPGLFLPSQVSVKDGCLRLQGEKMAKDSIIHAYGRDLIYNIACAAVVSKKSVFGGYYEARIKAAATTMSTTFWFSSGKNYTGINECDKYGLEWDIQECIGRTGDFKGNFFAYGMHSNSHYWYTDCDGERHDYRAPQVIFKDNELASKDFHIYGGWWRDSTSASYYYDNREAKHQKFYNKISSAPFDKPMYMRLVSETYPFPWIELPNDKELSDSSKNIAYYDWVRGYKLVDVDTPSENTLEKELKIYDEDIIFETVEINHHPGKVLRIPFLYKANETREINLVLRNSERKVLARKVFTAYAGFANVLFDFEVEDSFESGSELILEADIRPVGKERKDALNLSHLIINVL